MRINGRFTKNSFYCGYIDMYVYERLHNGLVSYCWIIHSYLPCLQVGLLTEMVKIKVSLKLDCGKLLSTIHVLLGTLSSLDTIRKDKGFTNSLGERGPEQVNSILVQFYRKIDVL